MVVLVLMPLGEVMTYTIPAPTMNPLCSPSSAHGFESSSPGRNPEALPPQSMSTHLLHMCCMYHMPIPQKEYKGAGTCLQCPMLVTKGSN